MQIIADLQVHSRFSRAVSREMTLPNMASWASRKGIGLLATGDWTHPMWFREIERDLEETGNGLLKLKGNNEQTDGMNFLLATEVSCIYSQGGKGRRVHTLVWVPSIASARKISQEMTKRGCNLLSDGRPIIGLTSIEVAELVLTADPTALVIPAHAWTPWFSLYGSMSGFNSIDEAFGKYAKYIYAVETGLSSSPDMNWRIKELDHRSILSFSDAHSGPKIGREATVFEIPDGQLSFGAISQAIVQMPVTSDKNLPPISTAARPAIAYTIEFFPEEGKYHYTGHRACNIRYNSEETVAKGTTCPVCGKPLTQGVMQRVEELAGRSEKDLQMAVESYQISTKGPEINLHKSRAFPNRPGFVSLVPLQEILSECIGSPVTSVKVKGLYDKMVAHFGGEFNVLLNVLTQDLTEFGGERVAMGIDKVRRGDIVVDPGYDGVFGIVKIWSEGSEKLVDKSKEQLSIF